MRQSIRRIPLPHCLSGRLLTLHDIIGIQPLGELAQAVFGDIDPTQVFHRGPIQEVVHHGDTYILRLPLPHVEIDGS